MERTESLESINIGNKISERFLVFLISVVYFIDVIDFMMVMPLGPSFDKDLGISPAHLGFISGSYTLAAAVIGFGASGILDKFDRKYLILVGTAGLAFTNILGGLSFDYRILLFSRVLAGLFGGIATSVAFTVISDLIPPQRRGAAMSKVWGAFSVSSVLGVPFGLELANIAGWRMPFFVVSFISIIVFFIARATLPNLTDHISEKNHKGIAISTMINKKYLLSYGASASAIMAAFMIIPYIAAYLKYNLAFEASRLSQVYLVGGLASFFAMRFAGMIVDKYNATMASMVAVVIIIFSLYFSYINHNKHLSIILVFALFMVGMSIRNVTNSAVNSKVPSSHDRAGFMSFTSGISHLFSSLGSGLSSVILVYSSGSGLLINMDIVAIIACILFAISVLLTYILESKI